MSQSNVYGLLINEKDILLQRNYFSELVTMLGVQVKHRAPRANKTYTMYSELDSCYFEPVVTGCIFEEHPDQRTMKKLGWNVELQEAASIISVPYDLQGLEQGSLFEIPDAFNIGKYRLFRVVQISGVMIYPASLTCHVVPEYETTFSINQFNHTKDSFNLLNTEDEA